METLNLIILGLIISFVALYYYRKYIVIEDSVEGFRSRKTLYNNGGVPYRPKRNTAYINMIADDYLHIYVGRGQNGRARIGIEVGIIELMGWFCKMLFKNISLRS